MLVFISLSFVTILLLFKCCIKDLDCLPLSGGPQDKSLESKHMGRHDNYVPQLEFV